jgi:hypothetical protein
MDRLAENQGDNVLACVARDQEGLRRPHLGPVRDAHRRPRRRRPSSSLRLRRTWWTPTRTSSTVPLVRIFDDRGRVLDFASPPRRVVSLVPSDTLNVAALGCAGALVGRTDYCELPATSSRPPQRRRDEEPARRRRVRARAGSGARQPGGEHARRPGGAGPARGACLHRVPSSRGARAGSPGPARARLRRRAGRRCAGARRRAGIARSVRRRRPGRRRRRCARSAPSG